MLILLLVLATTSGAAGDQELRAVAGSLKSAARADGEALWWPVDPDQEGPLERDFTLYHGSSGVVLFFLHAGELLEEPEWTEIGRRGALGIARGLQQQAGELPAGLYTGIAGMGFALLEASDRWDDPALDEAARLCVQLLRGRRQAYLGPEGGTAWNDSHDIISGTAGIGLFLLHAARRLDQEALRKVAVLAGANLLQAAVPDRGGLKWPMAVGNERLMPGFSHGTAGIGYFLATLSLEAREGRFLEAALGAGRYLEAVLAESRSPGLVFHHEPGGEDLHYLGWCHGPAGTGRLFYRLWQITGDRRHLLPLQRGVTALLEAGIPSHRPAGFWNNVGVCCGSAGIAEYLSEIHLRFPDERNETLVKNLTDDLIARAQRDAAGMRFPQAEHRTRPEQLQAQTGYMQGAAGVGLWLLRRWARENGKTLALQLPDSPFP